MRASAVISRTTIYGVEQLLTPYVDRYDIPFWWDRPFAFCQHSDLITELKAAFSRCMVEEGV